MSKLPAQYAWLEKEGAPKMLVEALKLYGTKEVVGPKHNPEILSWAKEVGLEKIYLADETPWCGLFMALIAKRAGKVSHLKYYDLLRALKWAEFGIPVNQAKLGDVIVVQREGGGHVFLYVGEDKTHYHGLGGNQGNQVSIIRIAKDRTYAICRPQYLNGTPANVRKVILKPEGEISTNEA